MSGKLLLDHAGAPASGSDIEYQRVAGGSPSISNARAARTRTSPCCFGACRCRPARLVGVGAFLVFLAIASLVGFIYLVAEATFYASLCGAIEALFVSLGVVWLVGATLACLFFKSAMSACNNARTLFRGPLSPNAKGVSSAWSKFGACLQVSGWVLAGLGFVIVWAGVGVYVAWSTGTQPNLTETLHYPGLLAPVTVQHEPSGVVHIRGTSDHDVAFAQGVVHAQYRMWQMEFQRRVGNASLAEVAGAAALATDKEMAMYGFYAAAEEAWTQLQPETKAAVQAYTDGINAYLDSDPHLPFEFIILGYKPNPWRPADSLVWAKLMALELCGNMNQELARYELETRLGIDRDRVEELMPTYNTSRFPTVLQSNDVLGGGRSNGTTPTGSDAGTPAGRSLRAMQREWVEWARRLEQAAAKGDTSAPALQRPSTASRSDASPAGRSSSPGATAPAAAASLLGGVDSIAAWLEPMMAKFNPVASRGLRTGRRGRGGGHMGASNNWVVGGNRTATGKPLLCNDPHLSLTAPSIWFLNHLDSGDGGLSSIGASFPGLPGVVIGRNDHIAWGVTDTGADVQDLYIMDGNATHYRYKGGWKAYDMRHYSLKVKDEDDVNMVVRHSIYGPVINDNNLFADAGTVPLSLSWTSILPNVSDTTMDAFWQLNHATDWQSFRGALSVFVSPSQNFIFADVNNNIGYQMPGLIPLRNPFHHSGAYPVPGNGSFDWQGYIPFDSLPRAHNPEEGFIASANNQVTPVEGYKYLITKDWDSGSIGYRALRITTMIKNHKGLHDVDSMKSIQLDSYSQLADDFITLAGQLIPPTMLTSGGVAVLDRLSNWDRVCDTGSRECTLFEKYYVLLTSLAAKETNTSFWDNPAYLYNAMQSDSTGKPDIACTASHQYSSCAAFAAAQLNKVAAEVYKDSVSNVPRWGNDIHQAEFVSELFGTTPLACFADRFTPHGGDESTVNVGHYDKNTFVMEAGPSYRQIVDLNHMQSSLYLNPLGQSGNEFSAQYDNLLAAWSDGDYLAMRTKGYHVDSSQTMTPA